MRYQLNTISEALLHKQVAELLCLLIFLLSFAYKKKRKIKEDWVMATIHMSIKEYQSFIKHSAIPSKKTGPPIKKAPKYHNIKVFVYADGFVLYASCKQKVSGHGALLRKYDSVKEYNRSNELRLLERVHKIDALQEQVPFEISPAFVDNTGKKHLAVIYRADFTYIENGQEIVEDVKAKDQKTGKYLCTEAFKLKWKIMQAQYPQKIFRLF